MSSDLDYSHVVGRIWKIMAILVFCGTGIAFLWKDSRGVISFLAGAGVSAVSFYLLDRFVRDLGAATSGEKLNAFSVVLHVGRMFLLGGGIYVILRVYGVFQPAFVVGLILALIASTVEGLIELLYARA